LPVGVVSVEGEFDRGDTIRVCAAGAGAGADGRELARGIVSYGAADLARLCRRQSNEIEAILGYTYGDEVIHRNDLVML
jgi:glutamate 5-kinase